MILTNTSAKASLTKRNDKSNAQFRVTFEHHIFCSIVY